MNLKKCICVFTSMFIILGMILPHSASAASTTKYGVLIGDENEEYTVYDNLVILSPKDNVMVKAYLACKKLGLSYSYDKETKKLTIKNKANGRMLIFTRDNETYTFYSKKYTKGIKKTAEYKCYYDKTSKCYVVHNATLKDLLSYTFQELNEDIDSYYEKYSTLCNDYYDLGYKVLILYNKFYKTSADSFLSILEPTDKMVERLKSYDYNWGSTPLIDFNEIKEEYPENVHAWIYDVFCEYVVADLNELLYTNESLTYVNSVAGGAIRFVVQTTLEDGTIEEQDVEWVFSQTGWGEPELVSRGFIVLGDKRIIKP